MTSLTKILLGFRGSLGDFTLQLLASYFENVAKQIRDQFIVENSAMLDIAFTN